MADASRRRLAALLLAVLLAACASLSPPAGIHGEASPPSIDSQYYEALAARGEPVFTIDAQSSLVAIEVRRAGSLASLGHDHVVASHGVRGFVAPVQGRADLYVPLAELAVDEPGLRASAGFGTQPSAADVAATRENMMNKVLRVQEHPYALVRLDGVRVNGSEAALRPDITLNGVTRSEQAEVTVRQTEAQLHVAGSLVIRQRDFGIAPFSVLGGAIQVQDAVSIRFELLATRMSP